MEGDHRQTAALVQSAEGAAHKLAHRAQLVVDGDADLEEVKGYCYSRLTPYKVPSAFEIRNELPRNTVGKLLKRTLIKEELDKRQGKE